MIRAFAILLFFPAWALGAPEVEYDVVVYGATPAGIAAAVAAAREKASVVVLEPGRHPGGMVAGGLSSTDTGDIRTIGGLCLEYFKRASARYGRALVWKLEPHVYQEAFREMVREAGFEIETGRTIRAIRRDGRRIVALETTDGRVARGKVFVAASYEGDLMAKAGVSYAVGREGRSTYGEPLAGYYPMPPSGPARRR